MTYTPEERAQIAAAMTAILATDDTAPLDEILERAIAETQTPTPKG